MSWRYPSPRTLIAQGKRRPRRICSPDGSPHCNPRPRVSGGSCAGPPCHRSLSMHSARAATRSPLVLMADAHEWFSRALESVLVPGGYSVVKAYTATGLLQQLELTEPDALILAVDLPGGGGDRKSTRLNSSHLVISYAVFCL